MGECVLGLGVRRVVWRLGFSFVLMLLLCVAGFCCCVFAVDEYDAELAIAEAEDKISVCYDAVAEADDAGANITDLLFVLNEAAMLLSKAKVAWSRGDFDSAFDYAVQGKEKLANFVEDAIALKEDAVHEGYRDFMVNFVGSFVGAVFVVCVGFVVWFLLKRHYAEAGRVG